MSNLWRLGVTSGDEGFESCRARTPQTDVASGRSPFGAINPAPNGLDGAEADG
jgi:hypothetical protein